MLTFDEATHQYAIDGVAVPSVTQLVAPLGDGFDDMDAEMELTVEAAADRGVTMHAYIAHRLGGGVMEDFELPSQYLPYADAVELFLSEHSITPMLIETAMAGDGYAPSWRVTDPSVSSTAFSLRICLLSSFCPMGPTAFTRWMASSRAWPGRCAGLCMTSKNKSTPVGALDRRTL